MNEKKYAPEFIRQMIQKGIEPEEGWGYLRGIAEIREKSFTIHPAAASGRFGRDIYHTDGLRLRQWRGRSAAVGESKKIPYGWTCGLSVPTEELVRESIASLCAEAV